MAKYFDSAGNLIQITEAWQFLRALRAITYNLETQCGWIGVTECPGRGGAGCEATGVQEDTFEDMIFHLNDEHLWSFDDIADWLDELPVNFEVRE